MATKTYRVHTANLPKLLDHIEKLNRKTAKLGLPAILVEVDSNVIEESIDQGRRVRRLKEVTITGVAPKLNGWTFVGTLQWVPELGVNILRSVPGDAIPLNLRDSQPQCDHCRLIRRRYDTFVVRNESGEIKQVGRNCLRDFLGHADPHALAQGAEWLALLDEFAGSLEDAEESGGSGAGGHHYIATEPYLAHVAAVIEAHGWVSRRKSEELNQSPTSIVAYFNMFPTNQMRLNDEVIPVQDRHRETATKALQWVREELAGGPKEYSEYEYNLMTACALDSFDYRGKGLVASLVAVYNREVEKQIERQKMAATSNFVGAKKVRQVFNLTLTKIQYLETQYGTTALHRFLDENGNVLTWFATGNSRVQNPDGSTCPMEVGKTYKVKGTVKEHKEYQGVKQTILSRCKVEGEAQQEEI